MPDTLCSFCKKSADDIIVMIAQNELFICNECIEVCNNIILEQRINDLNFKIVSSLPSPKIHKDKKDN